jgi:hypothetical protein
MKIKKNHLLTAAIMSLLGVSQTLMAAPVPTVMTLNGITKTVVFTDPAQAAAASTDPGMQLALGAQFGATSAVGLVSQSTQNGVPMSIITTSGGKVAVAQPNPDGTTSYVTVTKSTTGASASAVAQEYIKTVTTPGYVSTIPLAGAVKTGLDAATLALVKADVAAVGTNTQTPIAMPAGAITATTVIPTVTDPKALLQYQIDQQVLTNTLKTATAATTAAATLVDVPATTLQAGTINTVTLTPAIQLQTAQAVQAATTTVTAAALTSADPLVKNAAAQLQLDAANQLLTAATAAGDTAAIAAAKTDVAAATATVAANPAETAAVTAAKAAVAAANTTLATTTPAVATAKTAFDAAIADPNATQAQKQQAFDALNNAVTADLAAKQSALTAQQALVTALNADPSSTQAAKDAAAATLATLTTDIASEQNLLTTAKLQLKDPAIVDAATKSLAAVKAQTDKVNAAIGPVAAQGVTKAAANLNAILANVQQTGQTANPGFTPADITREARNLANELANVKTNQFQAKNNSTSGIAGNPSSAMNMTVDNMFREVADFAGTNNTTNIASASSDGGVSTSVGVGLQYGYYDIGGKSVNTVSLPLSVTAKFNPKHQLTLSVPLSYIATQNQSDAYQVGVGVAYKYSVTDNWTLTPAVSYTYRTFDNSQNQYWNPNNNTSVIGGSISSKYTWNFSPVSLSLINMIGHFQSLDSNRNATSNLNLGNFGNYNGSAVNNTLANYVVKNGLHATKVFGNFKVGAYFADTEYFGSSLYFHQFDEVGFTLKPQNAGKMLDALSMDANYLFSIAGKNSSQLDGFRLNLNYKY